MNSLGETEKRIDNAAKVLSYTTPLALSKEGREFNYGVSKSILNNIYDKPFTNLAIFGLSTGAGFVIGNTPYLVRGGLEGVGLVKTGLYAGRTLKAAEIGIGTGLTLIYAKNVGGELLRGDITPTERGEIFGNATFETALIGGGLYAGSELASKSRGYIATFGRESLPYDLETGK